MSPHIRATLPSMTHRHPQPAASNARPLSQLRYDMTQNVPKCPTFLRNHLSRAGCEPSPAPNFPSRRYSQLRNASECISLQHISPHSPSQTAIGPTPTAIAAPASPSLRPTTMPTGKAQPPAVACFANGPALALTLRYLRTHSDATRLRPRGRAMEAAAWPTQLSCIPTPTVHSRTP